MVLSLDAEISAAPWNAAMMMMMMIRSVADSSAVEEILSNRPARGWRSGIVLPQVGTTMNVFEPTGKKSGRLATIRPSSDVW